MLLNSDTNNKMGNKKIAFSIENILAPGIFGSEQKYLAHVKHENFAIFSTNPLPKARKDSKPRRSQLTLKQLITLENTFRNTHYIW